MQHAASCTLGSKPTSAGRSSHVRSRLANGVRRSPKVSNVDRLRDAQSILKFNAQVPDRTVHLGVTEQELDRAKIACFAVDLCSLGAPQRVRAVAARLETDRRHPLSDDPRVLSRRNVRPGVKPAREQEGAADHLRPLHPLRDRSSGVFRDFELNGAARLALDDRYAFADTIADNELGDPQTDEVAAPQLAVDGEIEQSEIARVAREFEARTDRPDLFRQQRPFLANEPATVPRASLRLDGGELDFGHETFSIRPSRPRRQHRVTPRY